VALVGDGPSGLPLFFVALIVLIVEHGSLAGLAAVAALVIGLVLVMAVAYRRPLEDIVPQSIGVLVLLALGLLIAQLVRETDQSRRENARLLAELRASLDSEKDLVLAQERARSASDLHDGLGHQLTAIQMGLDFADRMRTRDPHAAWEEVGRARDLSAVALDRMRVWVRALDPVPVGSLTGTAALEAVADAFRGTGLGVSVTTLGAEQPLDRERALFCLRVVQEGLTNALRHGGARRVDLVVDHADGLTLTLTDDGSAPETGDAEVATGYGLRSLTQRATRLGGDIDAGWSPDGFRLRAHLPKESA
jgi:signal transduction histidine kinase